ncbi:MAG: T4 family baseplate hub assembly chaperone [Chloroflexus sp.]|uniref:T4 family baseplate hub assembly chaperone n=1 Tax=Chloroflexus sp. TaxID=1904827 RepID=UPI00404AA41C
MMTVSASTVLHIWETGMAQPPVVRALSLLTPFFQDQPLAGLPVGARDALLLMVREWLFGTQMPCVMRCQQCAARLEFTLATTDLRALSPTTTVHQVDHAGETITFRLPTSDDLLAFPAGAATPRLIIERCLLEAPAALSSDALTAVATAMAEADPLLDFRIALTCPECGHAWSAPFDVTAFVWQEIDAWARRLLHDVHTLAHAYGWGERDILALSPWRRAFYLRLVSDERSIG